MSPNTADRLGLLHIDSAYTLVGARARGMMHFFFGRDASGLFGRVWSVHPVADRAGSGHGKIRIAGIGRGHGVVEGQATLCGLPRWLAPLNFIASQYALYRLLVRLVRRERLSVIVAVDPFLSGLLGLAVARRSGRPLLIRVSGNPDDIYRDSGALAMPRLFPTFRIQTLVGRFVLKRADLASAINANNLEYALANGARRAVILPISGHIERVHLREPAERAGAGPVLAEFALPEDRPFLLYFGRLIDLKHPDDALRAMARVIRDNPGTIGVIAGDGAMELALKDLARELGVADSIRFPGLLDQQKLSQLLPHAIVLSPSAGQMAILEAALGEAAIIAYDCDFQSEFILDGMNGFLVARRDWRPMAERAAVLLADPALADRIGKNARSDAIAIMAPERVKKAERAAFARILPQIEKESADSDPLSTRGRLG